MAQLQAGKLRVINTQGKGANQLIKDRESNELFFAVVGPVGAGASRIATELAAALTAASTGSFVVEIIKVSEIIISESLTAGREPEHTDRSSIERVFELQEFGDELRKSDSAAIAAAVARKIRELRAKSQGIAPRPDTPVEPNGLRRAYIIDSIKHPAEINLLRRVYGQAFTLIGVVCLDEMRLERLTDKYKDCGKPRARDLMERDADDRSRKYGQHVTDAFYEADFFVDNSHDLSDKRNWTVQDELCRLVDLLTNTAKVVRPRSPEIAMNHAFSASYRSACLSRQVGAALMDAAGNLISTGTNEVPRAGGGVWGEASLGPSADDHRCAHGNRYCSNTREQNKIIDEILVTVLDSQVADEKKSELRQRLRKSRVGSLIEFSRAVHAEMDALFSAARRGMSTKGSRLYVTTFPCHFCARHIVTAGVDEVQYIEPYPKSQALALHDDAITKSPDEWRVRDDGIRSDGKILFRPFVGVAPRLYARAFAKVRALKDGFTGDLKIESITGLGQQSAQRVSYAQLEADLDRTGSNEDGSSNE